MRTDGGRPVYRSTDMVPVSGTLEVDAKGAAGTAVGGIAGPPDGGGGGGVTDMLSGERMLSRKR